MVRLNAVEKATKEFNELRGQLLLKYAEAENLRKAREISRRVAENDQNRKFAKRISMVADEMLEISDKWRAEPSAVSEGIVMTANAMRHSLGKFDLEILAPSVGAALDKAVMDAASGEAGKVKTVKKHGWKLKDDVIRKAEVEVDTQQ